MSLRETVKKKIKEGFFRDMLREARWMQRYVSRYRLTVLIHIALGVLATMMTLLSSIGMKRLIDAVTGFNAKGIIPSAIYMAGMLLGSVILQAVSSRIAAVINIKVQNGIQAEVYDRMLHTDWEKLSEFHSGDLLNRLNGDVNTVSSGVTSFIPAFVSGSVQFLGSLAILVFYDPIMALIALIGAPISVIASRSLMKTMREYNKKLKGIGSDIMSFHEDSFRNLTTIKAFGLMGIFSGRMRDKQSTYRESYLEYNRFSVIAGMLLSIVGLIISAACFGWGVYRLWTGAITYGVMTMFLQLTGMLRGAFGTIIGLVPTAISITTSAGRIMEIVEQPEEQGSREQGAAPEDASVILEGVSFAYGDGDTILENVSFEARPKEFVSITGASGEGKTTVIRLLLGLIRPKSGRAYIKDGNGDEQELSAATRAAFSYVPQGNTVFAGTVADNLRIVKPEAGDEELWSVLRIACADDFVAKLPEGLYSETGEMGRGFSEGQAQRLCVARALLKGAPIILMDEATSALDVVTESRMLENIKNCGLVKTCIVVTHRPATAAICGRHYVINGTGISEEKL